MLKQPSFDHDLDTSGLVCPLPILRAKKALTGLRANTVLRVISTDNSAAKDFSAFAKLTGNILLTSLEEAGKYYFFIKKTRD